MPFSNAKVHCAGIYKGKKCFMKKCPCSEYMGDKNPGWSENYFIINS